jgi:hypothetical protein
MCPFKCRLCERARRYEGKKRPHKVNFDTVEGLLLHIINSPHDKDHLEFREKLGLTIVDRKKSIEILKEAIEKEKTLWYWGAER